MIVLETRAIHLELFLVRFVVFVVRCNFGPKGAGMIHMVEMSEFVQDNVIAKRLWDFHEADVKRNRAV